MEISIDYRLVVTLSLSRRPFREIRARRRFRLVLRLLLVMINLATSEKDYSLTRSHRRIGL